MCDLYLIRRCRPPILLVLGVNYTTLIFHRIAQMIAHRLDGISELDDMVVEEGTPTHIHTVNGRF